MSHLEGHHPGGRVAREYDDVQTPLLCAGECRTGPETSSLDGRRPPGEWEMSPTVDKTFGSRPWVLGYSRYFDGDGFSSPTKIRSLRRRKWSSLHSESSGTPLEWTPRDSDPSVDSLRGDIEGVHGTLRGFLCQRNGVGSETPTEDPCLGLDP